MASQAPSASVTGPQFSDQETGPEVHASSEMWQRLSEEDRTWSQGGGSDPQDPCTSPHALSRSSVLILPGPSAFWKPSLELSALRTQASSLPTGLPMLDGLTWAVGLRSMWSCRS